MVKLEQRVVPEQRWAARLGLGSYPRLQTRLVLAALLPALVILAAVVLLTLTAYYRVIESLALERSEALTRLAAEQVALDLVPYMNRLTAATQSPSPAVSPREQMLALRLAMPELQVFDGGVIIVDSSGHVSATDPRRIEAVGQDWSQLGFVQAYMRREPAPLGTEVAYIGPEGAPAVAVTIITSAQGGEPVLVAGLFRLDVPAYSSAFYRLLLRQREGTDRGVYLVDWRGHLVGEEPLPGYLTGLIPEQASRAAATAGPGAWRLRVPGGDQRVISYAPVPNAAWWLIQDEDWATLSQTGARYGRLLWLLLGIGLVLPGLLVGWQARRLMRPLEELTSAAQAMSQGELGRQIQPPKEWELYQMATSFNQMSAELQALYYGLERRVADRTQELRALHQLATLLGRSLDMCQTLQTALEQMAKVIQWPTGLAYRVAPESGPLQLVASLRIASGPPQSVVPDVGSRNGTTLITCDEAVGRVGEILRAMHWQCAVFVPLATRSERQGLILLGSPVERTLTDEQRSLLEAMARQVAMAADNARLYEQAEAEAVAAERNRLARELHDSVSQTLFSANLLAGVIPTLQDKNPAEAQRRQAELRQLTQGALAEMRTLLLELRPQALLNAPLEDLLGQLVAAVSGRARLAINLEVDPLPDLPDEVRLALYRTVQEGLNNIAKHAGAQQAWVQLRVNDDGSDRAKLRLEIRDDGSGFDPGTVSGAHLGLRMMGERAAAIGAQLAIDSQPGAGTCVKLYWSREQYVAQRDGTAGEELST